MKRLLVWLLAAVLIIPAIPTSAGPSPSAYHFLRVEGKADPLEALTLNGHELFNQNVDIPRVPVYVTKYLKEGRNELVVFYVSDKAEGLTVVIEARAPGPRKTELIRFHSGPDETQGDDATRKLYFTVHLPLPGVLKVTEADRKEMLALTQTYYDLLVRRDAAGLRKLYERALRETGEIFPEGVASFRETFEWSLKVLARPGFRMKPFQPVGLRFTVDGQTVQINRASDSPLMESGPVEIDGARTTLAQLTLSFKKSDGRWYVALPFGF